MTPAEIAHEVSAALEQTPAGDPNLHRLLNQALDAVSDGLPADDVSMILREALRRFHADAAD